MGIERSFYEFDYYIEFLGQATSVTFTKIAALQRLKQIKSNDCKFINERKVLR